MGNMMHWCRWNFGVEELTIGLLSHGIFPAHLRVNLVQLAGTPKISKFDQIFEISVGLYRQNFAPMKMNFGREQHAISLAD